MNVNTFFDAPSTTSNWMSYVSLPEGTHYIGADIVPDLITALSAKYGDRVGHDFRVIDIVHDALPSADLWLCRDVLGHLRNADSLADLTQLCRLGHHIPADEDLPLRHCEFGYAAGRISLHQPASPAIRVGKAADPNLGFHRTGSARIPRLWSRENVKTALL